MSLNGTYSYLIKIYMNNDGIKRGGTVNNKKILKLFESYGINLPKNVNEDNFCNAVKNRTDFMDWSQIVGNIQNKKNAIEMANAVFEELGLNIRYNEKYNNWLERQEFNIGSIMQINIIFPNFFSDIKTVSFKLNDNPNNTYYNIKNSILHFCITNGHIRDIADGQKLSFFVNSRINARDENGWNIATFDIERTTIKYDINSFINAMHKKNSLSKIIFVLVGNGTRESFIKNKVYGRRDLSEWYTGEDSSIDPNEYFRIVEYRKEAYRQLGQFGYVGDRVVQGDGNCYFTAFIFNLLEYAIYANDSSINQNIINALKSVSDYVQIDNVYDNIIRREDKVNTFMGILAATAETMSNMYLNMLNALDSFLSKKRSIFELERLFNQQFSNGEQNLSIFLPLIYGCRQILYQYLVQNAATFHENTISILNENIMRQFEAELSDIEPQLDHLKRAILVIGQDIADIVEYPALGYIFKCKMNMALVPNIISSYNDVSVPTKYNYNIEPNKFITEMASQGSKQTDIAQHEEGEHLKGSVHFMLIPGHYNMLYCHSTNPSEGNNNIPPIPEISSELFNIMIEDAKLDVGKKQLGQHDNIKAYGDTELTSTHTSSSASYPNNYIINFLNKHDIYVVDAKDVDGIYLSAFSRYPTEEYFNTAVDNDPSDVLQTIEEFAKDNEIHLQVGSIPAKNSKTTKNWNADTSEEDNLEAAIALSLSNPATFATTKQSKDTIPYEDDELQLALVLSASEAEESKAKQQSAQHEVDHYTNAANTWTKYIKTENYNIMQQLLESPQVDQEGNIIQIPNSAYIQIAFPNFRKGIDTILISINEDTNNIYFNIKSAIWKWSLNTIKTNRERKKSYFRNAYIDARDKNGWVIDSFIIKEHAECKIKTFIESLSKNELENIIFMPRGDGSNQSFVKNKVFGREDLSILYRSENAFSKENSKLVCTKSIELGYCGHRRVQGDGNCYYTSFIFNLLEYAIFSQQDIRTQIIYNVIYAINSLTFAENEHIYNKKQIIIDRNHISDEDISNNTKLLPRLLYELNSMYDPNYTIIDLEHLFNRQVPDGKISRLFIVLIYAIRKLLYNYIKNNYKRLEKCPSSIIPITNFMEYLNNKYPLINASKDYFINLLIMDEDIDEITEFSFFAYIFKCAQYDFSLPNNKIQMVKTKEGSIDNFGERSNYTKYVDPFTARANIYNEHIDPNPDFIPSNLTGVVNCVLSGGHYDIIYHSNNVPNPIPTISPIFKKLIIDGYYTDVGMSSKAVEISYTDMGMSSTDVEMSSTDVEMSSKAVEISSKAVEMPIVVKQPVKSLRVNYSNEIINNALRDLYSTDGENGINILIKCKRQKINDNRFDSSALDSHILFLANKFLEEINSVKTSVIGSLVDVYANLDNSWRAQKYMDEFEKYRKQYKNDKEFSEQITKYFSSNITPHKIKNNEITNNDKIYDIVYEHTIKVCQRISNKLYGNNICNILIIGAIEWDKNNNIFIPPLNFTGKTNFIYCDIRLIDNVIAHNSRNYECKIEDTYIKYILDTNHSQIFYPFQNLKKSALMKFLECLFDYITFDTGVLGDPSLIITRDSLITELYPLLKQNGKIYFENVKKGIKTNNNIETETAHWVIFNKKGTAESVDSNFVTRLPKLPMVARTYNSTTKSEYYDPPLDFEKVYHDWAIQANETTQKENMDIAKEKGKKLKKTKPNIIIKYKKDGSKYINPLIKDCSQKGSNEYNIEISFSKEYCDEI